MTRLAHKKGRPTKYRASLKNNPYWNEVKRQIRLRDNHRCRDCGRDYNLEVHHITYYKNGVSIVGKELEHLDCLILLCEKCHHKAHKKS